MVAASDRGGSRHQPSGCFELLKRVELRILRELTETVERQKARQTLRLEHLFAEAMRAWTDSKTDMTRRRQRKTQPGSGPGATIAEIVTEIKHGDPRYLEEARKALADHRKIWGLDAPQKVDVRASRNPYADMTEDDLRTELARQARLLGAPDALTPNANRSTEPSTPTQPEPNHADHQ